MNSRPQRPWTALAAIAAALLVATHGASAAEPVPTHVDVVGQMSLHEACPASEAGLSEALADAWDDAVQPSTVAVTCEVHHRSVDRVTPQTASPRVLHEIRRAVYGLQCDGRDDATHTVRLVVKFVHSAREAQVALAAAPSSQ